MTPLFACLVGTGVSAAAVSRPGVALDVGGVLIEAAREFSPRIERPTERSVVCDIAGLERLFGDARAIAAELRRDVADRHVMARVAVASTRATAAIVAHASPGITVVEAGAEAATLASLPLSALDAVSGCEAVAPVAGAPAAPARFYRTSPMQELARQGRADGHIRQPAPGGRQAIGHVARLAEARARHTALMATLARWGLRTLGDLAALPSAQLSARLGQPGIALQRLARGEDTGPLVPLVPDERFEAHLDLEWPIEGLEPLSFVLGRLLEPLGTQLERRGRAAATLTTTLRLVSRATHVRTLQLPAPMRDPRALRTLALLDLESHPPGAGIDAVTVAVEPTPGRVLQFSLLERALPAPEQLSTLVARLSALMGQDRCGSPRVLDTDRPGAFALVPFAVNHDQLPRPSAHESPQGATATEAPAAAAAVPPAVRRFRHPVPVRVLVEGGRPACVTADRPGVPTGRVEVGAGPWRTAGDWWAEGDDLAGAPAAWDAARVHGAEQAAPGQAEAAAGGTVAPPAGAASNDPSGFAREWRTRAWNRDEWDVALEDGSLCRIFQDRDGRGWFLDGVID